MDFFLGASAGFIVPAVAVGVCPPAESCEKEKVKIKTNVM